MLIENKNIESINVIENLKKLGVEFRSFIVSGDPRGDGKDICVITAGLELLTWLPMEDLDTPMGSMFKEIFNRGDKQRLEFSNRMPYKEPEEMMDDANIYLLSKYKSASQLNLEGVEEIFKERQKFGKYLSKESSLLSSKEELEKKIVYIHENDPTTNSLAMARQFRVKHYDLVKKIFELLSTTPHVFNGISWNVYTYESGNGNTISHALYLEINEYVYQKIVRSMGTPKTVEMRIYREGKLEEYYRAFTNLRADHYNRGGTTQEMFEDIDMRKKTTEILFKTISNYVDSYNNRYKRSKYYRETKVPLQPLPYDLVKRIMINLVNKYVGVNSFDFSSNRDSLHSEEVRKISIAEGGFSMHIEDVKDASPKDVLLTVYCGMVPTIGRQGDKVIEENILKDLKDYNVGYLWTELNKYPAL